jgi:hypothetical protein
MTEGAEVSSGETVACDRSESVDVMVREFV